MCLLPKIVQNVLGNLTDAIGVQQGLLVLRCTELFLIQLSLNGLELRAHIVVIDLDLQYFFITNSVGDDIRMQFAAEHAGSGFCAQRILREDGRAGETKLVKLLEFFLEVLLRLAKLATVTFIKDEDDLFAVDCQLALALH